MKIKLKVKKENRNAVRIQESLPLVLSQYRTLV